MKEHASAASQEAWGYRALVRVLRFFSALPAVRTLLERLELAKLATVDPITDLLNERGLYYEFRRKIAVLLRTNEKVDVCMICGDLDGFKLVNDQLGHPEGNKMLKRVAFRLHVGLREADDKARPGGDEFSIVLYASGREEGVMKARELLATINEDRELRSHGITMTLGVSHRQLRSVADLNDVYDTLYREADVALLEAKRAGKNRVAAYRPPQITRVR